MSDINIKSFNTDILPLSLFQDSVIKFSKDLKTLDFWKIMIGKIFHNVSILTIDTSILHTLGYEYTGFIVCGKTGIGDIYISSTLNSNKNTSIILKSTVSVVASILVY